jgi:hypothetical protein
MNILNKLPNDLQEKILNHYEDDEKIRNLIRKIPIIFNLHMTCMYEHYPDNNLIENDFNLESYITCDSNNLVWVTSNIYWGRWSGWSYNFYNIPIGYLYSEKQIKVIVRKWKDIFAEYIKYNYSSSKYSFKNLIRKHYKIEYGFDVSKTSETLQILKSKYLYKIIKNQWFSDQLFNKVKNNSEIFNTLSNFEKNCCEYSLSKYYHNRFHIDDACPDLGSDYIRPPYTYSDLKYIKKSCPNIYKCLEDYDELYSINYKLSDNLKSYVKLYLQLEEENSKYYENQNYKFENIDPPELFNQKVKDIIQEEWLNGYTANTGYLVLPKLHFLLIT